MQFKKFEAADMREALAQVKQELGPDAVIVATREVGTGMFRSRRLEITAAIEDTPPPKVHPQPVPSGFDSTDLELKLDPLRRELRALRGAMRASDPEASTQALKQELGEMRAMIARLSLPPSQPPADDMVSQLLSRADVDPEVVETLVAGTRSILRLDTLTDAALPAQLRAVKNSMADLLRTETTFFTDNKPKRVALVGPTGVGKTTTIAKVAAHAALIHNKSVALISLDTYRVAAFEQLKQYATLIDVPLTLVRDAAGLHAALRKHANTDIVLIDTAGRSPAYANGHRAQLSEMFVANNVDPYLTISASTRSLELRVIIRAFAPLDPKALVFTKLDEASALGAIANASARCSVPLAFVCNGQRVPEDMAFADPNALAKQIVDQAVETHRFAWRRSATGTAHYVP